MSGESSKLNTFDGRFCFPSSWIIYGSSMSGKSQFVSKLLEQWNSLFVEGIDRVCYFYGQMNDALKSLVPKLGRSKITLIANLPENLNEYLVPGKKQCFVFDDLGLEAFSSKQVTNLFIKQVHHNDIACILIVHNLYAGGSERLNILRNAHYLVLFRQPLDKSSIYLLARRIMPRSSEVFLKMYEHCTEKKFGYLVIEGHPNAPNPDAKFRCDIFGPVQKCMIPNTF